MINIPLLLGKLITNYNDNKRRNIKPRKNKIRLVRTWCNTVDYRKLSPLLYPVPLPCELRFGWGAVPPHWCYLYVSTYSSL